MKKTMTVLGRAAVSALLFASAGCAISPLTQPEVEGRDDQVYVIPEKSAKQMHGLREKFESKSLSILVDCHVLTESGLIYSNQVPLIRENLLSDINSRLGSLSFFRVIPTDTALANLTVDAYKRAVINDTLDDLDESENFAKAPKADFTVIASVTYVSSKKDSAVQTSAAVGAGTLGAGAVIAGSRDNVSALNPASVILGGAAVVAGGAAALATPNIIDVKLSMELYDAKTEKALLNKTIHRQVPGVSDTSVQSAIIKGLADCAKEYMEVLADNFGARGRVLKTVGGGRFARISLGRDNGLEAGSTIAFLEITDQPDDLVAEAGDDSVAEEAIASGGSSTRSRRRRRPPGSRSTTGRRSG